MATVLVIEDDTEAADAIDRHLSAAGHRCVVEGTGDEALERAKECEADLVILDVMLPGISGFEVCRRIRRDSELFTLPVIVLSAMRGEEEVAHGLAQGADDFVSKPFNASRLAQRVDALLRTYSSQAVDTMTRLPDSETLKREVQRRISNEESFCMVYAEMLGLQRFGGACGNEYRDKAIRHFGRALKHCGDKLEIDGFFVGHMGGGYFVCLLPPEYAERFGKRFLKAWRAHLPDFYARCGKAAAYEALRAGQSSPVPLIDAVICMTEGNPDVARSPKEMFETLSRLRQKALLSGQGGIHADKRGAGPAEL